MIAARFLRKNKALLFSPNFIYHENRHKTEHLAKFSFHYLVILNGVKDLLLQD